MVANPAFYTGMVGPTVYSPSYFIRSFIEAQNRANAENERRYQDSLNEYRRLRSSMIAGANAQGDAQLADINDSYRNQGAQMMQNLTSRGLASSTVVPTMQSGLQRERMRALGHLRESLAQQRAQADQMGTDRMVNIMQSKYDNGPDPSMLMQMMQNYGSSGAGSRPPAQQQGIDPFMAMLLMQQLAQQQQMAQQPPQAPMQQPMRPMRPPRRPLMNPSQGPPPLDAPNLAPWKNWWR